MRKLLAMATLLLLVVGCENTYVETLRSSQPMGEGNIFHATLDDASRTYLDEDVRLRWNADDEVTIFDGCTRNKQYLFAGEEGSNAGDFTPVAGGYGTGNPLKANYAIYPYAATTTISEEGIIGYTWPEVQNYAVNTVGRGANVMVAATEGVNDYDLVFRNVGSMLRLKLYGSQQAVGSIVVEARAGEPLSGSSLITPQYSGAPTCKMTGDGGSVTLDCGSGVLVGNSEAKATSFWIVIPAGTYAEGIKVTVNGVNGESQSFEVTSSVTMKRNTYKTMLRNLTDVSAPADFYGEDEILAEINEETRTYLDSDGLTTYWLAGDEMGVYTEEGSANLKFVSPSAADAWSGRFLGTLGGETPKYAYYPYSESAGSDPAAVKLNLATEQYLNSFGLYDIKASDSSSVNDNENTVFTFKSVLTLLTLRINAVDTPLAGYTLKSVRVQAIPAGEGSAAPAVTGDLKIDMTNGNATLFEGDTNDYVEVVLDNPKALASGQIELPALINPASVVAGTKLLVTVNTVEGPSATITRTASKSFVVNKRYTFTMNMVNMTEDQITYDIYDEGNPMSSIRFEVASNPDKMVKSSLYTGAVGPDEWGMNDGYYVNSTTSYDVECIYDSENNIWVATIPYLYDFSNLVASFTTVDSGAVVTVNGVEQVSGTTVNDFSTDLSYTVTNSDGTIQQAVVRLQNTGLPVVTINGPVYTKSTDFDNIEGTSTIDIDGVQYTAGVRLRGNSTQRMPKKPYAIKLDSKAEVLGMPKHKRWVLLANWLDRTMLRNDLAFYLAQQTGRWAPRGKHVELVLNGVHVGNYFLCEQIKIDSNRLDIADVGMADLSAQTEEAIAAEMGFLLECDQSPDSTEIYFRVSSPVPFYVYIKDPSDAEAGTLGYSYIQNYFSEVGTALHSGDWTTVASLIDYESFADHWLYTEITENQESKHPKSFYMHKTGGGKLSAGPAWDYDWGTFIAMNNIGSETSTAGMVKNYFTMRYTMWYQYLFNDPAFIAVVKSRWAQHRAGFYTTVDYLVGQVDALALSEGYNNVMWPVTGHINGNVFPNYDETLSWGDATDSMYDALVARLSWMDGVVNGL